MLKVTFRLFCWVRFAGLHFTNTTWCESIAYMYKFLQYVFVFFNLPGGLNNKINVEIPEVLMFYIQVRIHERQLLHITIIFNGKKIRKYLVYSKVSLWTLHFQFKIMFSCFVAIQEKRRKSSDYIFQRNITNLRTFSICHNAKFTWRYIQGSDGYL